MYEKPELTLVGEVQAVVLGPTDDPQDNEGQSLRNVYGLVHGLDD